MKCPANKATIAISNSRMLQFAIFRIDSAQDVKLPTTKDFVMTQQHLFCTIPFFYTIKLTFFKPSFSLNFEQRLFIGTFFFKKFILSFYFLFFFYSYFFLYFSYSSFFFYFFIFFFYFYFAYFFILLFFWLLFLFLFLLLLVIFSVLPLGISRQSRAFSRQKHEIFFTGIFFPPKTLNIFCGHFFPAKKKIISNFCLSAKKNVY